MTDPNTPTGEQPPKDDLALEEQQLRMTELRLKIKDLERIATLEKDIALKTREDNLKVSELELKVNELAKSDFKRVSTYTGLLAVLIAFGGVIGQNIWSGIKNERTLLAADTIKARRKIDEQFVNDAISKLKKLNSSLAIAKAKYNGLQLNIVSSNKSIDSIKQIIARFPTGCITPVQKKHIDNLFKTSKQDLSSQIPLPVEVKQVVIPVGGTAAGTGQNPPPQIKSDNNPSTGTVVQQANPAVISYPGDPQKGKWGMKAEFNGRKVTATVSKKVFSRLYQVIITITSTDNNRPLKGPVKLHLPDSFPDPNPVVDIEDGQAVYYLKALSAFTFGVETDAGSNRLEYDLMDADAPDKFKHPNN